MRKRYTLISILAVILTLAFALITTSLVAQNRNDRQTEYPKVTLKLSECYEKAGVNQETLDAIDELRRLAEEQLKNAENRKEKRAILQQLLADIQKLLTEEQLEAIHNCMKEEKPATCMDQIELTPEQIEAIDSIRAAALADIKEAQTFIEVRIIIEQMQQAVEDVLTETQLEKLRECREAKKAVNCMDQIGLSDMQINQIYLIQKAAIEAAKLATTREEIRAIMDKMAEDILTVLTPEQIDELNKCRDSNSED